MKHLVKFTDALQGTVSVSENKKKYFKTKDSTSKSGHSIVAKIAMTHSGIVTKNYGFYMPGRMSDGAKSFSEGYAKPVIVGHDENPNEQAEPVGRVIDANYIDTSGTFIQKDSYLKSLYEFQDKKKTNATLDFVHHIINNYENTDSYQGLGYIEGLLKITDEEAIQKILDERYLTVSTSMMSDSATCSVCATDWVKDGRCEHQRGMTYDDKVCVVVPGRMEYDHLGIVNAPADPHAHTFQVVNKYNDSYEIAPEKDRFTYHNELDFAASLFGHTNDGTKDSLFSLSSKEDVNLIEVKDSIQRMENAMAGKKKTSTKKPLENQVQDSINVSLRAFRYNEEGKDDMEIQVSQYMSEASEEMMKKLSVKVMGLLDSSKGETTTEMIDKTLGEWLDAQHALLESDEVDEDFVSLYNDAKDSSMKKKKKKSKDSDEEEDDEDEDEKEESEDDSAYKKSEGGDGMGEKKKKKKAKKMSDSFKLVDAEEISEEVYEAALKELDESESHSELNARDKKTIAEKWALKDANDHVTIFRYADCKTVLELADQFNGLNEAPKLSEMTTEEFAEMANQYLEEDSKITAETTFKSSDYCGVKGFFPVVDEATHNAAIQSLKNINVTDSALGRVLCALDKKADKLGLSKDFDSENDSCHNKSEVTVESMLSDFNDLRNKLVEAGHEFDDDVEVQDSSEEIEILESQLEAANEDIDELELHVGELKDSLTEQLSIRLVDMKLLSDSHEIEERAKAIEEYKSRTIESLKDSVSDLEKQLNLNSVKINDGLEKQPEDEVAEGSVKNPVLQHKEKDDVAKDSDKSKVDKKTVDKELDKNRIYDTYRAKCRGYGKLEADKWLKKIQKRNNLISTLD